MYSSFQSFTLQCSAGTTGASTTQSASADSIISQRDADTKALGLAKRLAFEYILCALPAFPVPVLYCSDPVTASTDSFPGYVPETFTITYGGCAFYSLVSATDATNAAQLAAQLEAYRIRNLRQRRIYYNTPQTYSNTCSGLIGGLRDPLTVTITVDAGTWISTTSQAQADYLAQQSAASIVLSTLSQNCIEYWLNSSVSFTASCTLPLVGAKVTVTVSHGQVKSYISQADADTIALDQATTSANSMLACQVGFYNMEAIFNATCEGSFGNGWAGADSTATVPAGKYFATLLIDADLMASNDAALQAVAGLRCYWSGGGAPP